MDSSLVTARKTGGVQTAAVVKMIATSIIQHKIPAWNPRLERSAPTVHETTRSPTLLTLHVPTVTPALTPIPALMAARGTTSRCVPIWIMHRRSLSMGTIWSAFEALGQVPWETAPIMPVAEAHWCSRTCSKATGRRLAPIGIKMTERH